MKKVETTTEGKARKQYAAPSLEELGTVAELTGGTLETGATDAATKFHFLPTSA